MKHTKVLHDQNLDCLMSNLLVQLLSFKGLNDETHNKYKIAMNLTEVAQDKI
jgi:hypothetical protein